MMWDYTTLAFQAVEKAIQLGAVMVEVYCVAAKELTIEVSNQQLETLKMAQDYGMGMRVFFDNRMGFAFTSDLSEAARIEMVKQAMANTEKTAQDPYHCLPQPVAKYPELHLLDDRIGMMPVEDKIELAMEIERQARAYDKRVKITESCTYQDADYTITLVNSAGLHATNRGAYCGAYAFVVAEEDGDNQTGFALQYTRQLKQLDPVRVGRQAGENAVRILGARRIHTQREAVVLDPYVATNFLGVIAPALSAEAVQKKKSLFAGKMGEKVASHLVSIIDEGNRPGGINSAPFDGEGVPTRKTELVRDGYLNGFLHNSYSAAKDGVSSTGNGVRGTFKSTPEVGPTNLYLAPGIKSPDEIIGEVEKGFYVTEVMGIHTANPISGDFSVGAVGLLIEKGRLTSPVKGVAIAGNVLELLSGIDCIGNDLTFFGGKGSPTVRVARMTISGT